MRCSVRRCRGTLFPTDAHCGACGLEDVRLLRWLALADGRVPACGNCATLAGRRRLTLDELTAEVLPSSWGQVCRRLAVELELGAPASSERHVA
jgi:hypothetical protein